MTIDIQPIEASDQHFVEVVIDGDKIKKRGPYCTAGEAEAEANRIAAICKALRAKVHRVTAAGARGR